MADLSRGRTTTLALSVALGASLLVIAFLLGRESVEHPRDEAHTETPTPASPMRAPAEVLPVPGVERRWPDWADLEEWTEEEAPPSAPAVARVERHQDGSVLLSNRGSTNAPTPTPAPAASANEATVSDYFLLMDTIRSEVGAGDPNVFAMDMIKAALSGSTAGFDQLIADTKNMESATRQLTPPPECARYHQANIEALAESREVLEQLRSAISRRDFDSLAHIARDAQALQAKAQVLQQLRRELESSRSR